jgi:hypothetical protein
MYVNATLLIILSATSEYSRKYSRRFIYFGGKIKSGATRKFILCVKETIPPSIDLYSTRRGGPRQHPKCRVSPKIFHDSASKEGKYEMR